MKERFGIDMPAQAHNVHSQDAAASSSALAAASFTAADDDDDSVAGAAAESAVADDDDDADEDADADDNDDSAAGAAATGAYMYNPFIEDRAGYDSYRSNTLVKIKEFFEPHFADDEFFDPIDVLEQFPSGTIGKNDYGFCHMCETGVTYCNANKLAGHLKKTSNTEPTEGTEEI